MSKLNSNAAEIVALAASHTATKLAMSKPIKDIVKDKDWTNEEIELLFSLLIVKLPSELNKAFKTIRKK